MPGAGGRATHYPRGGRSTTPCTPTAPHGPADGRVDGSLGWAGLAPGDYLVVETLPPTDAGGGSYGAAPDAPVTITAGEVSRLTVHHDRLNALTILKVDAAGAPLPGACFAIEREESGRTRPTGSAWCDDEASASSGGPPGDGRADGILVLPSNDLTLTTGTYTLIESKAPDGYAALELATVELAPDRATVLTITNDTGPVVAGTREGEHAPPLPTRDLRDHVRGGAEAIDPQHLAVARKPQGPIADQAGA